MTRIDHHRGHRAPGSRRGPLHALYEWPAFYGTLLLLGSVQLAWSVIAWAIRPLLSEAEGRRVGRLFVSRLYRACFWWTERLGLLVVDAAALDAIDPDEAMVIAPNHPSVLDALILISRLENLSCIMKASVLDNPFLGAGAKLAGYIRNDGPKRMLRLSADDLRNGGQLIVFPEGTRTMTAPVGPFKSGFAAMARIAGVPVQTVFIETDTPFLSKGWSVLKKPPRLPMHFRARLGQRFEVDRDAHVFVCDLHRYFSESLADAELGGLWAQPTAEPASGRRPAPAVPQDARSPLSASAR